MSELFRQKSMERISSPEELNDYIRVTSLPVWIILAGIVLLLVGMLVWGAVGEVEQTNADGTTKFVHPITYVTN